MHPAGNIAHTVLGPFPGTFGTEYQHVTIDATVGLGTPTHNPDTETVELPVSITLEHPQKPPQTLEISLPERAAIQLAAELTDEFRQHPTPHE